MTRTPSRFRITLDRTGIVLSGLCAVHCLASVVLLAALGAGGSALGMWLLDPAIHRFGLVIALFVAAVAIGLGALRHRRAAPFVVAMTGLSFMGGALAVPHGMEEAVLTIIGVALVSAGHILNLRGSHQALSRGDERHT
ncbi:hypothetical protein HME9302_02403 [Alteripontixanthobacter maritimus]|uniref:MerC domain-containing protein n=1 Tax=Alteripontixanthobacter maritimus TaxID=2161824 RepID=A0A369Q8Z0_9SPHN|nr:MerC domain-containing protein [Alteripontixanthobacter maritimus]RDC61184.1 hypothetical protein HME9302_02403 [Alteripontixanthobacter maritimus]